MEESSDLELLIQHYFHLGLQQKEILLFLSFNGHDISIRTLKRRLKRLKLYRRKQYTPVEDVVDFLRNQLITSGQLAGYKWMHRRCIQHRINVKQAVVRHLLNILDPQGVCTRRRRRLRRRKYFNKGPNYLWHIDGYDKLKPYGICIHGCIDGFSRKILWIKAAYSNNNPRIVGHYFVQTIMKLKGFPQTIRSDMGTENTLIERMQVYLNESMADYENNNRLPPFIYETSQANQRIEAWWTMLRRHNSQFWMNIFEKLKGDGFFNGTTIEKCIIQYCFVDLIQAELEEFATEWNTHVIRRTRNSNSPSGRPDIMFNFPELYDTTSYLHPVDEIYVRRCQQRCMETIIPCADRDVFELCEILCQEQNISKPKDVYQAANVYVQLRTEIIGLLRQ